MKIAYIMSRFPKITETFILFEILELRRRGINVEIYPIMFNPTGVMHSEARALLPEINFTPFFSIKILLSNLRFFFNSPKKYITTLFDVLMAARKSANFFFGSLAVFPKSVFLSQLMKDRKITHIHAHFANHPTTVALIISRLTGIRFSFTSHGSDIHKNQNMLEIKTKESSFACHISNYNKNFVSQCLTGDYSHKMPIVHVGVNVDRFVYHLPRLTPDKIEILCVGSLLEVKGHRFLIQALEELQSRDLNFFAHFVGDGPLRTSLIDQVHSCNLAEKVQFHGCLTQDEIATLMGRVDIFALTSVLTPSGRREGIPTVLIEAMACGLPVVSSRISGIPELIVDGENGLLAEPKDVNKIADQLQRLIKDYSLRWRIGKAARQQVESQFMLTHCVDKLVKLFM